MKAGARIKLALRTHRPERYNKLKATNMNDRQSQTQRKAQKRALESDRWHTLTVRGKAALHASKRAELPHAYARGSTHYAAAFYGRTVTPADIQRMASDNRHKSEAIADAAQ